MERGEGARRCREHSLAEVVVAGRVLTEAAEAEAWCRGGPSSCGSPSPSPSRRRPSRGQSSLPAGSRIAAARGAGGARGGSRSVAAGAFQAAEAWLWRSGSRSSFLHTAEGPSPTRPICSSARLRCRRSFDSAVVNLLGP